MVEHETDDRIADAVAVKYLYGGPACIIDFGTATTFNALTKDGEYLGGAITAGTGTVGAIAGRQDSPEIRYTFNSPLTPSTVYRYDPAAKTSVAFEAPKLPVDLSSFETKALFATSKDGTRVPFFLTAKKNLPLDGNNPTLLQGYGGFGISQTPDFSANRRVWIEQGGVLAIASLRGGGEFGEEWHKAGMLEKKQNVFDDFIGAAEWLIANRYTSSQKLAVTGGSNGGLLVGAFMTQRPELCRAVVCSVPLLDMLRYHKFTIGSYWKPDYGDPDKESDFKFLYAYSPAHNVKPGTKFPSMLITTADTDTRVHPMHAKKFAAAVQAATVSDNPILLRVDTKAGHGAGKPISKQIEETADLYGFVMERLGMQVSAPAQAATRGSN